MGETTKKKRDEQKGCWSSQICEGVKWAIGFLGVFSLVLILMWAFLHQADLPVTYRGFAWNSPDLRVHHSITENIKDGTSFGYCVTAEGCGKKHLTLHVQVTIGVFLMAMLSFLGWFLFCVFAGIGLVALPIDLFNSWKHRPKPIPLDKYAEEKRKIGQRAAMLREAGNEIRKDELNALGRKTSRKEKRELTETFHRFENVLFLCSKKKKKKTTKQPCT
ncbi:LMBR1-like conserved region-containing protein [Reticulomyxa filosa]|uniref:LMBR1-like conserved region-containing protein n=1 Tax=Reticulomyxa filosa TaxID=46433 RepID=X6P0L6_RETFI|nr:LMBR1-like conserved region-containing protein [Reticulomyxa filosa]|eukprot:ETO32105.1 LMBR1-like conserved region-containing protein [Reticulomyxa filosa]